MAHQSCRSGGGRLKLGAPKTGWLETGCFLAHLPKWSAQGEKMSRVTDDASRWNVWDYLSANKGRCFNFPLGKH
jgi:hypothetical protein